jgi:hypothetical protein
VWAFLFAQKETTMSKRKTNHLLAARSLATGKTLVVNTITQKYVWELTAREAIEVLGRPDNGINYCGCVVEDFVLDWVTNPNKNIFVRVCF